ncbi:hypothetical protein, partial [Propioniciclava flava]
LDGGDALASAAAATVQQVKTAQATATQLAKGDKTLSCPASLRDTAGACEAYAQGVRAGGYRRAARRCPRLRPPPSPRRRPP